MLENNHETDRRLTAAINKALEALMNVPVVGNVYDQQHSDTQTAAYLDLKDAMKAISKNVGQDNDESTKSSVQVRHWDCYGGEHETANTHQFDVDDQRKTNGQMYVDVGAIESNLDDMLCLTMEVNTNPLNGVDHVPCVHVSFDGDNLAVSLFKIGNKILLRPETDVSISKAPGFINGREETFFWIE
jgi:hypothetical protein